MAVRAMSRIASGPALWIFLIVVAIIWLLTPHETGVRPSQLLDTYRSRGQGFSWNGLSGSSSLKTPVKSNKHPIRALHDEALRDFEAMLERQSKTLEEAVAEYKLRYHRDPPPGFDKWFAYAKEQNSPIIDEFDMIDESMQPFWKLEPHLLKQVRERASDGPQLWSMSIHNGHLIAKEEEWMGNRIGDRLKAVLKDIPDLDILVNPLDEPRILLSKITETDNPRWTDGSQRASWDTAVGPCKYRPRLDKRKSARPSDVDTHGLPFVTDRYASMDICQNPTFQHNHGFFIAPFSFVTTSSPVPILSQAAPSTFSDIIYPSMWYWDNVIGNLDELEPAWEQKHNKMYWSGSTTGGYNRVRHSSEQTWESHRHRFIEITKQLAPDAVYKFLAQSDGGAGTAGKEGWTEYESGEVMQQLYDTKFTRLVQCEAAACEKDREYYKVASPEDGRIGFKSRFLMDIDGNSFSGRFYNFLASRSCPLKQTIFREWHDERLIPWVHYVPISTGMEELPETMRYLALTEEGSAIAKDIAERGREWYKKVLRSEDASIYLYRLFLEYARVSSPDRNDTVSY